LVLNKFGISREQTTLDLSCKKISDVTPLASLTNLTWLDLGYNQVSDVTPLASLTNLTRLYLDFNPVREGKVALETALKGCRISW
jgi:Leucine-rich repeat (LRR) protein